MYTGQAKLRFLAANSPVDVLLPPFTNIAIQAAVQTAVTPIPANWCYDSIFIEFLGTGGAVTLAMIQEYRVRVNGTLLQQMSGTRRNQINVYHQITTGVAPAGVANNLVLNIPFRRLNMRGSAQWIDFATKSFGQASSPDVENETLLNCGMPDPQTGVAITQVLLEVDFVNTNAGGVTGITHTILGKVYPAAPGGPGPLMFENQTTFNSINGTNQMTGGNGLLYGDLNHAYLESLFLFPPAGTPTSFQFWLNSQLVFIRSNTQNVYVQQSFGQRTPTNPAGGMMVAIDFCEEGFGDGVKYIAPQATSCRLQFVNTAAEGVIVVERAIGYLG